MLHIIDEKNTETIRGACALCGYKGIMTLIIDRVLCGCGNIQRPEEMPDDVSRPSAAFTLTNIK